MFGRRAVVAALLALATALSAAACGSGASGGAGASGPPTTRSTDAAVDIGPTPPGRQVQAVLTLRDDSGPRRAAATAAMSTPGSPNYGHYLTPGELAARYGPDPRLAARVLAELRTAGLAPTWQRGDDTVQVSGSATALEATLGVRLHDYREPSGLVFYGEVAPARLPARLRGDVTAVARVSDRALVHTFAVPGGGLTPADAVAAYGASPLRQAGIDGSGQTIVLFMIDGYDASDLDAFRQRYGLPAFDITERVLPAGAARPKPAGEATMDLEIVHAIAPKAKLAVYTSAGSSDADLVSLFQAGLTAHPGAVATASFGGCERALGGALASQFESVFSRAAALGVTTFASSGDSGGFDCYGQDWTAPPEQQEVGVVLPAGLPSVTGVGGTTVGVRTDGSWLDEAPWYEAARLTGSGGGVSALFARPSWQKGAGTDSQGAAGRRLVPDVSADADPNSGLAIIVGGHLGQGGGTSQAAPIWAGLTTLIDQYLRQRHLPAVGFANPKLYDLANGSSSPFHDVTIGSNGVFRASPGYDPVTGLGTPDAAALANGFAALAHGSSS